jgi:hypothetical protein
VRKEVASVLADQIQALQIADDVIRPVQHVLFA